MDYEMIVKVPIQNVPDDKSIQEAKVTSEIWLKSVIPDAELLGFRATEAVLDADSSTGRWKSVIRNHPECTDAYRRLRDIWGDDILPYLEE